MKGRLFSLLVASLMTGVITAQPPIPTGDVAGPAVVGWVREHIKRFQTPEARLSKGDLTELDRVIGGSHIIALGEPAHGIREFLELRNRVLQFLVENKGITALAAETGYSESLDVDRYINGSGELTPAVIGSTFSWSADVAYPANRELLEWLRAYNSRPTTKRKVHFYGLDLTGGRGGNFSEARRAVDDALAWLATVDRAGTQRFHTRLEPLLSRFTSADHDSLSAADQNELTAAIDDLVSLFERKQPKWAATPGFASAYHEAVIAKQLDANFRAAASESNPQAQREASMAQNMAWLRTQEGLEARVMLFAANWHISKGPMWTDRFDFSLGERLQSMYGNDYLAIAGAYGESQPATAFAAPAASSLAAALMQPGLTGGLLDLRTPSNRPVAEWFAQSRAMVAGRIDNMVLGRAFDAVIFLRTVHTAA